MEFEQSLSQRDNNGDDQPVAYYSEQLLPIKYTSSATQTHSHSRPFVSQKTFYV